MEEKAELQQQLEAAIETRQEFRDLLKSPAWAKLVELFRNQAEVRLTDCLTAAKGLDGLIEKEGSLRERNVLLMFASFPDQFVQSLDDEIAELNEILNPEEED